MEASPFSCYRCYRSTDGIVQNRISWQPFRWITTRFWPRCPDVLGCATPSIPETGMSFEKQKMQCLAQAKFMHGMHMAGASCFRFLCAAYLTESARLFHWGSCSCVCSRFAQSQNNFQLTIASAICHANDDNSASTVAFLWLSHRSAPS